MFAHLDENKQRWFSTLIPQASPSRQIFTRHVTLAQFSVVDEETIHVHLWWSTRSIAGLMKRDEARTLYKEVKCEKEVFKTVPPHVQVGGTIVMPQKRSLPNSVFAIQGYQDKNAWVEIQGRPYWN